MTMLNLTIRRNIKLFFKDKGMFFTALITPLVLLVLYSTFLTKVYKDALFLSLPDGCDIPEKIINGAVGGQLFSSLLAVCCITVAFCSNMLMVQDKVTGAAKDMAITPVSRSTLAMSYYIATLISTFMICAVATGTCFVYIGFVGWYLRVADVISIVFDVILLVLLGTALSSIVNFFLNTQGQISAIGSIVSSGYGFICGAYMPISNFSPALQKIISFFPGTYGTSLLRNHTMRGAFYAMEEEGVPNAVIDGLKDAMDLNIYFFDIKISEAVMYTVLALSCIISICGYVFINYTFGKRVKKR